MRVKFWGVRGSIASPGKETSEFGGNTSCIEMEDDDGNVFVFDAGTGIRALGMDLAKRKVNNIHLFITHTHWDHIQGFPFFTPAYIPGTTIHIYGPSHFEKTLKKIMDLQMDYAYFPISMQQLNAKIDYTQLKEASLEIGKTTISTKYSNHPVTGLCYKVSCNGKTVVYSGDTEPYYNVLNTGAKPAESDFANEFGEQESDENIEDIVAERNELHRKFCQSDLLIHDAQYTEEEYGKFKGWGHSPMEAVIRMAESVDVKQMALNHHDPTRSDQNLHDLQAKLQTAFPKMNLFFTKEGMEIRL